MTAEDLPPITLQATREFAARIASVYPSKQTILFGSRARGTAHDESDADVARRYQLPASYLTVDLPVRLAVAA